MNIEYEEEYGDPIVHIFGRLPNREKRHIIVEGHRPSFYIPRDAFNQRVRNNQWVHDAEGGYQSIKGSELVRVYTKLPWHVGGKRDRKGMREYFDKTWEADVWYCNRFLIDTEIKTHLEVNTGATWERDADDADYRVSVDDISPADADSVLPRMVTVDIEVESPDGFPEAGDAEQPVTAITAYDNYDDEYTVWALRYEGWPYSDNEIRNKAIKHKPDAMVVDEERLGVSIDDVKVFDNESQLLHNFNKYVGEKSPDLLSGWNSSATDNGDAFDYPYLLNRSQSLNTMSFEEWSPMGQVWTTRRGYEQNLTMGAKGVTFFDMLQAYKKTQWAEPKGGWGLSNISDSELGGDGKLEIEDIDNAWKDEPATFLEYNIRDVQAVVGIDKSAGVTSMFQNLRTLSGAQFGDCYNNIDLLDIMILRYADEMGMALPTNEEPERGWYYGAKVFEPKLGRHNNVVYPDLWSMYPNMIRNVNMSPETLIGTEDDLADSPHDESDCRWTYIDTRQTHIKKESDPQYEKVYFLKPSIKEGFLTRVVDDLMVMKDEYDGTPLYMAIKRVVNSIYGVFGDSESYGKGYRLFDWRVAEGITLGGRKMITDSADKFVDAVNEVKETRGYTGNDAYLVGGDTDSVMTSVPFISGDTHDDYAEVVDIALEAADIVNDWYGEWTAETFNLTNGDHYCELEIESYGPRLFIPEGITNKKAKKRYAEIIAWEEGEWFDPPEFSVTGIDIVRSDRAEVTREVLEDVLQIILREDDREQARTEVYERINEVVYGIRTGEYDHSYYARPKGMSQHPSKYGSPSNTPLPTYRGAKYANEHFEWENMSSGDKPQLLYIEDGQTGSYPPTYPSSWDTKEAGVEVDAIAVSDPSKLPDDINVNTSKMIEKTLRDPLTPILSPMRWDFDSALSAETYHEMNTDEEQNALSSFM